ncbi:FMN-binding protein [Arthrobacter humicola]|uniref:FMN-binding protein n=1 Tax=Arthrobacter humicola TaxID=409291 RepID=UPI001FABF0BA|nr:FMN-binding protein [Arthrobacter humicola]MCI9869884.1 FMN-binding protein [Arthrobacter humicola]
MRTRAAVSAALASAGILIAGWQSGVHVADTGSSVASAAAGTTGATGSSGSSGTSSSSGTSDSTASSGASGAGTTGASAKAVGTYPGSVVQTRFGSVQVQITVQAGKITDVTALQLTDAERKSVQISNRAAPILRDEVLQAQSADVQTISGATVTSEAYLNSLQAALDAANL